MRLQKQLFSCEIAYSFVLTGSAGFAGSLTGLVSRVIAAEQFETGVDDVCRTIAKSPPEAVRRTKKLFYELEGRPFESGNGMPARSRR